MVHTQILPSTLLVLLALAAGPAGASLDDAGLQRLAALQRQPDSAVERIYKGEVHERSPSQGLRLFTYERRVALAAEGQVASHITSEADGTVVIEERAQVDTRYGLRRFEAVNAQTGQRGSVEVSADGRRLSYRLFDQGATRTATEELTAPAVSGPSLHGFILQHWPDLLRGKVIPVRFIVLAETRTYGFDIALAGQAGGQTRFSATPSSWWVRLAVAPLSMRFDDLTRHVVSYEGRVPPMVLRDGRRQPLDARVDYTMEVPVYR
jgi:hypothetical protein